MVTAPNLLHAAVPGAEPAVYYSGRVFLAMILTLGQKLGAPEATPAHSVKDSKNIFERRFEYSNEEKSSKRDYNACLQGLENNTYRHQSCNIGLVLLCQHQ